MDDSAAIFQVNPTKYWRLLAQLGAIDQRSLRIVWHRLKEIFSAASEAPPQDRAAVLDRLCEGDTNLRGEAEELLALREEEDLALDHRAPIERQPGDHLGRYRITSQLQIWHDVQLR